MALTKVDLANTVEGILPVANGGTGTSTGVAPGGSTTQIQYNNAGVFAGSANMTFNGTTLTVNDLTDSSLTAGRVVYAGTAGNLTNSTNLTFDGTNLFVGGYYSVNNVGYVRSSTGLLEFQGGSTATRFMDSTYASELMRITQAGNVGIGTSSPSRLLSLSGGNIGFQENATTRSIVWGTTASSAKTTIDGLEGASGYLVFGTNNTERMRITSAGNVGIGLTNPTQKLEVTGTIKINGGVVAGERGTAAAPAFSFSDNLNSGMFNISNLDLGFATQGVERMRITSAGGVSFGATGTAYGTSGQVLTSAGNAPPTWGAVAGVGVAKAYGFINNQSGSAVTYNTLGVSSVTQTNTGRNTINWTTAFPNANYIIVATTNKGDGNYDMNSIVNTGTTTGVNQTTTQAFLANGYSNQFQNSCQVCFVVFYPS